MLRTAPIHPIRAAIILAKSRMDTLELGDSHGAPIWLDLEDFVESLLAWAAISDAVTLAFGEYARTEFGISKRDLDDHFKDQLARALDGNADHVVAEAFREHFR